MRKVSRSVGLLFGLQLLSAPAWAAVPDNEKSAVGTDCDIVKIATEVATRLKKSLQIDPRVRACVVTRVDPAKMSYGELQALLALNGYVDTAEIGGVIQIVPEANARMLPLRLIDDRTRDVGEYEMVMKVIDVGPLSSSYLVPILRPLLTQYSHLVSDGQTNSLIVVARYGNIRSLENLVRGLRARPLVPPAKEPPTRSPSEPAK